MFKFHLIGVEYSSEISLLILVILSIYISILIYKKNLFLKKFLYIFFFLSFFVTLFQIILFDQKPKIASTTKISAINFPDKLNIEI